MLQCQHGEHFLNALTGTESLLFSKHKTQREEFWNKQAQQTPFFPELQLLVFSEVKSPGFMAGYGTTGLAEVFRTRIAHGVGLAKISIKGCVFPTGRDVDAFERWYRKSSGMVLKFLKMVKIRMRRRTRRTKKMVVAGGSNPLSPHPRLVLENDFKFTLYIK
jgi:hypothetical protein